MLIEHAPPETLIRVLTEQLERWWNANIIKEGTNPPDAIDDAGALPGGAAGGALGARGEEGLRVQLAPVHVPLAD